MAEEIMYTISNEFEKEVIVFNTITCLKLFELGNNAVILYMFYVKTAKIQGTNSVYAVNSFCKKGLGWGDYKFNAAKKLLIDNGLIEMITKKDENGIITGHYIRIHYLKGSMKDAKKPNDINRDVATHKVDSPTRWTDPACGSGETNAVNKKGNTTNKNINADNKKDNTVRNEKILSEWNNCKIIKHYTINATMKGLFDKVLEHFTLEQIISAIRNYGEVVNSDKYYFSYKWSLVQFLSRGISKQGMAECKGFQMFLSENEPHKQFLIKKDSFVKSISEVDKMKNEFNPITVTYQKHNLLDKTRNTYFGFETDRLKDSRLMQSNLADVKWSYGRNEFNYGDFKWLEEIIASIYFNRKAVLDMELLKMLIGLHEEYKSKFKQEAIKNLGG